MKLSFELVDSLLLYNKNKMLQHIYGLIYKAITYIIKFNVS